MKPFAMLVCLIVMSTALGACNTMCGFGKDVERGGERVQDAATSKQKEK